MAAIARRNLKNMLWRVSRSCYSGPRAERLGSLKLDLTERSGLDLIGNALGHALLGATVSKLEFTFIV
jgi:hypothetical protein